MAEILRQSRTEYDAIDPAVMNWSRLKHILDSPLHFRYRLTNPKEDTDGMRAGRAIHCAIFEAHCFDFTFAVWSGGTRRGKEWDAFCSDNAGRDIITDEQAAGAQAIAEAVHAHPLARKLLSRKGQDEATLLWRDRETGIHCKGRLDRLMRGLVIDVKSSGTIEARRFGRTFADLESHGQVGFYNLGLLANGRKVKWKVLAIEQKPPFDLALYNVNDDQLYAGEERAHEALRRLKECRRTGRYPGRYPKSLPLDLPPWCWPASDQEERRELMRMEGLL